MSWSLIENTANRGELLSSYIHFLHGGLVLFTVFLERFCQALLVKAKQPVLSCGKHLLVDKETLFSISHENHLFDS